MTLKTREVITNYICKGYVAFFCYNPMQKMQRVVSHCLSLYILFIKKRGVVGMKNLRSRIEDTLLASANHTKSLLADQSGDQMTGMLIVILCVVVAGSAFMGVYQGGLQAIWGALQTAILNLLP